MLGINYDKCKLRVQIRFMNIIINIYKHEYNQTEKNTVYV